MNLIKMFEMQQALDNHILDEHPELKGQDNLDWKVLAFQVELGECANEWRGFKKWSNNQEPRLRKSRAPYMDIDDADFYNPLLEEYVDGLHFVLSIGLELKVTEVSDEPIKSLTLTDQFNGIFNTASTLAIGFKHTYDDLLGAYIGLGEMLGFTQAHIEEAYMAKNAINHERQNNGY